MVTATTGTMQFKDLVTNEIMAVSCYLSDVVAAPITWNKQGAAVAGSDTTLQFSNPVVIMDVSIITGPTVSTGWYYASAGTPVPNSNNLISPNLTTIQNRNFTRTGFKAGSLIKAIQF